MATELATDSPDFTLEQEDLLTTVVHLTNDTAGKQRMGHGSSYDDSYHDIMLCIISACGLLLNVAALSLVFHKHKHQLLKPTDILLVSQLILDGGACFSNILWVLLNNYGKPTQFVGSVMVVLCKVVFSHMLTQVCLTASIFNIVLLTLERYFMVIYPVKHRSFSTRYKAFSAVAVNVILSIIYLIITNSYPAGVIRGMCVYGVNFTSPDVAAYFFFINVMLLLALPIATFVVCYSHMFIKMYRQRKVKDIRNMTVLNSMPSSSGKPEPLTQSTLATNSRVMLDPKIPSVETPTLATGNPRWNSELEISVNTSSKPSASSLGAAAKSNRLSQVEMNILKTIIILNLSFLACNLPSRTQMLIWGITGFPAVWKSTKWHIMSIMASFYLFLHPIIYVLTLKKFRKDIKKLFISCNK